MPSGAVLRLKPDDSHLRHGGTVSGPSMFALADIAAYIAILAHVGPAAMTVTTNMNINFLHKPAPEALDAHAMLLKLGKRLAVTEIAITGVDDGMHLVAKPREVGRQQAGSDAIAAHGRCEIGVHRF